jgi:hypothetical protein
MTVQNYQLLIWDGSKQKRIDSESTELILGKLKLGVFTDVEAALSQEIADRQAAVAQEISDRQAAVSAEQAARESADSGLSARLDIIEGSGEGSVAKAKADSLQYTDEKVAALVDSAPAILDTLKELSASLGDDPNFATTITTSLANTQAEVDAEEVRAAAAEAQLQSNLDAEEAARIAADSALDARVSDIETDLNTQIISLFENNAAVYADARPAVQDPSDRDGWYYKNAGPVGTAQNKVNWYFFDGTAETVSLGDFGAYTVVTFDNLVSKPHLAVYTMPTGSNDIGGWYKSRVVYVANQTPVAGVKYLMYFGQDPLVHPELPRLTMSAENSSTRGTQDAAEQVMTAVLGSDGGTAIGNCEFVAEAIGVCTPSIKRKIRLRIQNASKADLVAAQAANSAAFAAEQARAEAAEAGLQAEIDALEVVVEHLKKLDKVASAAIAAGEICYIKADGTVAPALATIDLSDAQLLVAAENIASGATGKLYVMEGSVVGGFSSLTPGKKYFVSASSAGAIVDSTSGFTSGASVYSVGRAVSATELSFAPVFEFEY